MPGQPHGADFTLWHGGSYRQRNRPCQISSRSVKGFGGYGCPKSGVSDWLWSSPLQQCYALRCYNVIQCALSEHILLLFFCRPIAIEVYLFLMLPTYRPRETAAWHPTPTLRRAKVLGCPCNWDKKAVLLQRWPRDAPYVWVSWKKLGLLDCPLLLFPNFSWAFVPIDPVNVHTKFEVHSSFLG